MKRNQHHHTHNWVNRFHCIKKLIYLFSCNLDSVPVVLLVIDGGLDTIKKGLDKIRTSDCEIISLK